MTHENLIARRKNVLPNALGTFNNATAVSAKGAIITDTEGRELIDFAGGIGVLNAGHCPPVVVEAIVNQAQKLIHSCFNVAMYAQYIELAELLSELLPHGDHTKVMLTNSGAEAVENAIKIARQATGKTGILCFTGAFHGRSMMAMTLTSKTSNKQGCGPFAPEVYRIDYPNYYKYGGGMGFDNYVNLEIQKLHDFFYYQAEPAHLAAVIIEVVQGEGGFNVVPARYLKALRALCTQHNILLICDEVQSGFGRTGAWGAYEHFGVTPDLSTWAKSMGSGMPIGCLIGKAELMDAAKPGTIGGTYLGNPVCCAASLATLKYMQEIDINKLGVEVGRIVKAKFESMQHKYSCIGDVRGLGAMLAFELVKNNDPHQPDTELCKKIVDLCHKKGLIVINSGAYGNVIRVLSPLTIEPHILHKGLEILDEAINELTT